MTYRTTCPYLKKATRIIKTKAIRAIRYANGMNRISVIIPCHHIIGANDNLT
ncbi:MGMT family protein [Neisseria sp. Ec49-e6-T10]|uniref:MGMT family protein n=1 Tax=Neisseria sp. Ec49-e6-T10 TaxID=3140744 RepID=UPI003EB79DE9